LKTNDRTIISRVKMYSYLSLFINSVDDLGLACSVHVFSLIDAEEHGTILKQIFVQDSMKQLRYFEGKYCTSFNLRILQTQVIYFDPLYCDFTMIVADITNTMKTIERKRIFERFQL